MYVLSNNHNCHHRHYYRVLFLLDRFKCRNFIHNQSLRASNGFHFFIVIVLHIGKILNGIYHHRFSLRCAIRFSSHLF